MHNTVREQIEYEVNTRLEDYGDLVVQNLGSDLTVPAANNPNIYKAEGVLNRHDVMGSVDRYGADEGVLLAQRLRMLEVALPGTYTAESDINFVYQLGFDGDGLKRDLTVGGEFAGGEFGANASIRDTNEVNNDVLYWTQGTATNQYADSATGVGGGADTFRTEDETNYLHDVGVLPEVSAREDLNEYLILDNRNSATPEDGQVQVHSSWQLYWLETDEEVDGRRIDITD